jgi:uncharacterized protein (TIGR03437 family)
MRVLIALAAFASAGSCADFTTYIGDANQYQVAAITTDSAGNTYVTGSQVIPTASSAAQDDVFVTKLDVTGNIVFTITFGGKANDNGNAIALDPSGNIWVGGMTTSADFPLHDALQNRASSFSPGTGFLVKMAPDGKVIYSSYLGGTLGNSGVNGVVADQSGIYVTGTTSSRDFPTTLALPSGAIDATPITSVSGAFITKLDPTGLHVAYSVVIAGTILNYCQSGGGGSCNLGQRITSGVGIALDAVGEALIAGYTNTSNLPVTAGGSAQGDGFAAKVNAAGTALVYLDDLGWNINETSATAITADAAGEAYLTGSTKDSQFPTTSGAYQTALSPNATNAFVIKLNPAGATVWATYLGGSGPDTGNSISLDIAGDVLLTGSNGPNFPTTLLASAPTRSGDFLAELNPAGSALLYSEELPAGQGIAIDQSTVIHLASRAGLVSTITPGIPFASRIIEIVNAASGSGAGGRIAPSEVISMFGSGLGPATAVSAAPQNGAFPTSLGGVQVLLNGTAIPLLYVSGAQINAEVPAPLKDFRAAQLQVVNNTAMLPEFRVWVDATDFGAFQTASGSIAAINQDGTFNSVTNPAKAGSIVAIWATGFDPHRLTVDGAIAKGANNWCKSCEITVGSVNETVAYAGAAPGLIDGLLQINFMVPATLTLGSGPTQVPVNFDGLGVDGSIYVSQ